ncbi:alpha/beta hydrolase [Paraburkholderia sediminicola]|uniref:alpha/beta hydrolase n=1 Tax=Paraburkholderia sediminicola TaxID=458836 RepID=UPI0038BD97C7
MEQKFNGNIGQVAGRDVKTNSAQSNVSVHIHNEPKPRYISDRQRSAIARKAYQIQAKTQTDKLMVYRRLMTVFKFPNMDEMPRDVYQRAMSYLEVWLRNGTTEQASAKATSQNPVHVVDRSRHVATEGTSNSVAPTKPVVLEAPIFTQTAATIAPPPAKQKPWRAGAVACGAIAALAAVTYIAVGRSTASAELPAAPVATQCEYGGHHYSIGSVVLQAGLRQQCVTTGENAATWEKLNAGRRVAGK